MPDGFSVCTNNGELWPTVFEDFGCCWWFLGHHFHGRAWGRSKGTGLDVVRVLPVFGFFANQGRFLAVLLQTRIRLLLHKKLHLSVYPWKQAAIFDKEVFLDEFAAALTPISGQYELPFLFVVHLAKQRLLLCLSILYCLLELLKAFVINIFEALPLILGVIDLPRQDLLRFLLLVQLLVSLVVCGHIAACRGVRWLGWRWLGYQVDFLGTVLGLSRGCWWWH